KNGERKLAEQETKCGSKTEQELHAYAWKSTHMRATSSQFHAYATLSRLGVVTKPILSTHRRRRPRICV
ncbi:hypothetical protein PIB30_104019, partial [Stylosanthes scabra]|nr:hypothetical protein [Stylosanthes scabra]